MKPSVPVLFLLILCIFAAGYSSAATLTVTKIEDTNDGVCDADCSLREAVAVAASGDTVVFSSLFNSPQTITLTLGQITIDKNLTITGTGPSLVDVTANLAGRVFNISGNVNVTISGIKLRDGRVGVNISDAQGGAILFLGAGSLNLTDVELTNNRAYNQPNDVGVGAAIYCSGCTMTLVDLYVHHNNFERGSAIQADFATANISDSVISNNRVGVTVPTVNMQNTTVADNLLAGVSSSHLTLLNSSVTNSGRGVIGGAANSTMSITNCLLSQNMNGGLLSNGSAPNGGVTTINSTTISNNSTPGGGGGILNDGTMFISNSSITGNTAQQGGGINTSSGGQIFLTNTTVSGNSALGATSSSFGGGIYNLTSGSPGSRVTLINSTVTNNFCNGKGGGIRQDSTGSMTIKNSIIAQNTSGFTNEADVSGAVISNGVNLVGNTTGSTGWIANDLLNMNPMLGPLADNGGGTMTHALLPGSPALDAGNNSLAVDPQTQMFLNEDQRGFPRLVGANVDIGAYESTQTSSPVVTGSVTYGNITGTSPRYVSDVLISGAGSPNVSATTLGAGPGQGTYLLTGFGSNTYTVTPLKTGGANGAIASFDSAKIAQHAAGVQTLIGNQLIVADVSGNGTISSFDAAQIARYTAGLNNSGSTGNWIFMPINRTYSSINSSISGQDFMALLMGDVSGNWTDRGTNE